MLNRGKQNIVNKNAGFSAGVINIALIVVVVISSYLNITFSCKVDCS